MKVKRNVSGLGNASRNKRVKGVDKTNWAVSRVDFFKHNVRFAAAAKANRTAMEVTQWEVAEYFNVATSAVANWESGKYAWRGGAQELIDYQNAIQRIAGG